MTKHISKEAWYTPGKGLHSATGWLEERLRNVRRKLNQTLEKNKTSVSQTTKLAKISTLPGEWKIRDTMTFALTFAQFIKKF